MLRKTLRRCGVLALLLVLALAGAAPASAAEIGGLHRVWSWLSGLFDLAGWGLDPEGAALDTAGGNSGDLDRIWEMEGPGYDPNGTPQPTPNEGPGYDPNGIR
jgi:hypothetical protein